MAARAFAVRLEGQLLGAPIKHWRAPFEAVAGRENQPVSGADSGRRRTRVPGGHRRQGVDPYRRDAQGPGESLGKGDPYPKPGVGPRALPGDHAFQVLKPDACPIEERSQGLPDQLAVLPFNPQGQLGVGGS